MGEHKTAKSIIAGTLVAATALFVINRLIRRSLSPTRIRETGVPEGVPWKEVEVPTARGKTLFAWLVPAGNQTQALVILHGWGGNAEMMLPLAKPLHAAGYTLLFIDARNHGQSSSDRFSSLPRFAEDFDAAVNWLQMEVGIPVGRIGLIGHSVGAGAALLAASRRSDLACVVSLAAFAHPREIMRRWLESKRIPYMPLGAYILFYVQRVIKYRFDDIAPINTIGNVRCPVLLVHGVDDETVPVADVLRIHDRRRDERTRVLLIAGGHDEYAELDRHLGVLVDFLNDSAQAGRREAGATCLSAS